MKKYLPLGLRLIIAIILIQTLRFKFTAHPDSVYIFTKVGFGPYGRVGIGILELIASILLIIRKTAWLGALIALGVLLGAVMMHLTILGIEIEKDGGVLFATALVTAMLSAVVFYFHRDQIPLIGKHLKTQTS